MLHQRLVPSNNSWIQQPTQAHRLLNTLFQAEPEDNRGSSQTRGGTTARAIEPRERGTSIKGHASKTIENPNIDFAKILRHQTHEHINNSSSGSVDESSTGYKVKCCFMHPNKKAKFFLSKDLNVGLCVKCAITRQQNQPLIKEESYRKVTEIDAFKQTVLDLKQVISTKKQYMSKCAENARSQYERESSALTAKYQQALKKLSQSRMDMQMTLDATFSQNTKAIESETQAIEKIAQTIENYLKDIQKNYEGIINDLSIAKFTQIMQQYQYKVGEHAKFIEQTTQKVLSVSLNPIVSSFQYEVLQLKPAAALQGRSSLGKRKSGWQDIAESKGRMTLQTRPSLRKSYLKGNSFSDKENDMNLANLSQAPPPRNSLKGKWR